MTIQIEQPLTMPVPMEAVTPTDLARRVLCIREMAAMLVLVQTGTVWDEEDGDVIGGVCDRVAAVREELGLSPDEIQGLLEHHEPSLAAGEGDWPDLLDKRAPPSTGRIGPDSQLLYTRNLAYQSDEKYPKITRRIGRVVTRAVSGWTARYHLSGTRKS